MKTSMNSTTAAHVDDRVKKLVDERLTAISD